MGNFMAASKAQSSMEYVLSYGWAILVVLVIGVALWQLGILRTSTQGTSSTGFSKIPVVLSATSLSETGVFTGTFVNSAGSRIFLTAVRLYNGGENGPLLCCSHDGAGPDCSNDGSDIGGKTALDFKQEGGVFIPAGDPFKVELGAISKGCLIPGAIKGDRYNLFVEFDYNTTINRHMVPHTVSGWIVGYF